MSAEILELLTRIAELERKLDSLFRHGPVHERKKIDGRWFVRLRIGGTEQEPFLSPWIPYSSPNGGPQGLNVHRAPAKGELTIGECHLHHLLRSYLNYYNETRTHLSLDNDAPGGFFLPI